MEEDRQIKIKITSKVTPSRVEKLPMSTNKVVNIDDLEETVIGDVVE